MSKVRIPFDGITPTNTVLRAATRIVTVDVVVVWVWLTVFYKKSHIVQHIFTTVTGSPITGSFRTITDSEPSLSSKYVPLRLNVDEYFLNNNQTNQTQ